MLARIERHKNTSAPQAKKPKAADLASKLPRWQSNHVPIGCAGETNPIHEGLTSHRRKRSTGDVLLSELGLLTREIYTILAIMF